METVDDTPGIEAQLRSLRTTLAPAGIGEPVHRIETHMSWVLLGGERVLKLKKPVHHPFLDFTTVQARERNAHSDRGAQDRSNVMALRPNPVPSRSLVMKPQWILACNSRSIPTSLHSGSPRSNSACWTYGWERHEAVPEADCRRADSGVVNSPAEWKERP